MKRFGVTALTLAFYAVPAIGQHKPILTAKQFTDLAMNVPEVLAAVKLHRCPRAELLEVNQNTAYIQVRSTCNTTGSGLLGNFTVDRHTGQVWHDVDPADIVNSNRLRSLRAKMFGREGNFDQ